VTRRTNGKTALRGGGGDLLSRKRFSPYFVTNSQKGGSTGFADASYHRKVRRVPTFVDMNWQTDAEGGREIWTGQGGIDKERLGVKDAGCNRQKEINHSLSIEQSGDVENQGVKGGRGIHPEKGKN